VAQGLLLGISPDGSVVCRDHDEFCRAAMARGPSIDYAKHDTVLSIERLDDTCASAKVQIVLPASPTSLTPTFEPTCYTDWLTLLHDTAIGGWRVISKVYSGTPFEEHKGSARVLASVPVEPGAFHDLASAVWDVYVGSGRACDGVTMATIFHPCSKLTFINDNGSLSQISCNDFCAHVSGRWSSPKHLAWSHLQNDPRASSADTLLSIDFAGPNVARVTLKIGYPPFLYHDVLLMLRVSQPLCGRAGWWIVAKSSANIPFLQEDTKQ